MLSKREIKMRSRRPWAFNNPAPAGKNMCPYNEKKSNGLYHSRRPANRAVETKENLGKLHRRRVECPVCKRRLWGWVTIGHDADFHTVDVPPHKRKKWWKKTGCSSAGRASDR